MRPQINLLIISVFSIFCSISASDSLKTDSLRIPTYEYYPITQDYVLNQTVINSFRWVTIGTIVGVSAGFIINPDNSPMSYNFAPAIGGLIGFGSGLGTGISIGIFRGMKLQRLKKDNPDIHAYRCKFGYELSCLEVGVPTKVTSMRLNEGPGFSFIYRTLAEKPFLPRKLSLGIISGDWRRVSDYNVSSMGGIRVAKVEGIMQYDFPIKTRLVIPNWGIGLGYSWGQETEDIQEVYFNPTLNQTDTRTLETHTYSIKTPILRGYIGCNFNLFDFTYADLKLGYEMIGPYLAAHNKKYFPYSENFIFGLSLGTFIF